MRLTRTLLLVAVAASAPACGASGSGADGRITLEAWAHAGQEAERTVLERQAARFNAASDSLDVELVFLPEDTYDAQVQASAVAGRMPDLLELDGPFVATYAWQGRLRPLSALLPDTVLRGLLPSVLEQGTWRDTLWAVGTFDSGLGLYARRSALARAGARIPVGPGEAWTAEEFTQALERLARSDADGAALDLKLNYEGEWFSYAFQPMLHSAGGGVLGRTRPASAEGTLDGGASVRAMEIVQRWIRSGLVDPNLDDAAFTRGRVALSLSGHWDYPRYAEAFGSDLLVLPLPDFGEGTRSAQGSWVWGIPRHSENPEGAAAFLSFLMRPEEVLAMTRANGAVPAVASAAERSRRYGPGGPLRLFFVQLSEGWTVPRPRTPAYPVITSLFQRAFDGVRNGESVSSVLHRAASAIDREIEDNRGYPPR